MSVVYLIEVNEGCDAITRVWLKTEAGIEVSSLEAAQSDNAQADIVAVLDGRNIACHAVQLPQVDDAKALKILPAVVDAKLAIADDKLHMALLSAQRSEDGERLVGVVSSDAMQKLRNLMANAGLSFGRAVPDYMLLDAAEDAQQVCEHDDRIVVRRPDGSGFAFDKSEADWMLANAETQSVAWRTALTQLRSVECNLMQGSFAPRTNWRTTFLWWRRAAILAALVGVLIVGSQWYGASQNYRQADLIYAAAEQAFRDALPDEPRIINMDAQLRRAIAARGQQGGGEFFALSNVVIQVMETSEQTLLETLRYEQSDGELSLDVSFSSFAESSNFKRQLEEAGVFVTEGSSRQEGGRVLSEIRVRRP